MAKPKPLADLVRERMALPPSHEYSSHIVYAGHRAEHARTAPLVSALVDLVDAAEDAIAQIKTQRGLWPAEVDTLEDTLAAIRRAVEGNLESEKKDTKANG